MHAVIHAADIQDREVGEIYCRWNLSRSPDFAPAIPVLGVKQQHLQIELMTGFDPLRPKSESSLTAAAGDHKNSGCSMATPGMVA